MCPASWPRCGCSPSPSPLGGVESLVTCPSVQTHADVPVEVRASYGLSDRLMRLSVGIEHVDDLIVDLAQAFEAAGV